LHSNCDPTKIGHGFTQLVLVLEEMSGENEDDGGEAIEVALAGTARIVPV